MPVATPTSTTAPPTTTTSSTSTTHELEHGDDYDRELEHDDDASLSRPEVPLIAAPHEGRRGAHIPRPRRDAAGRGERV